MEDLRYPVGTYEPVTDLTPDQRAAYIGEIEALPARMREAVADLTDEQLDTEYRPGGWTVRQVVHHVADSHMNSLTRFKLALTEENPTIKPYDEASWARLDDTRVAPVDLSLQLLDVLHARWVLLLRSLTPEQWTRTFEHPERGSMMLDDNLALYAWHGRHHTAHITSLRERNGW